MLWTSAIVVLVAVGVALCLLRVPAVARGASAATRSALRAIARRPGRTALLLAVAWPAWLGLAIWRDGRTLVPHSHDERSYLLQARIFSSGHLWLPTPAEPDFFDTFHVLVTPVYTGKFPPGTALVHAPALRLGVPWIVTSLVIAGAAMGLLTYAGVRLAGPWTVPISAVAAATGGRLMTVSLSALAQPVMLVGVGAIWCLYVCQRRGRHRPILFALAGAAAGATLLVRPADAALLIGPPGLLMLGGAWRRHGPRAALGGMLLGAAALAPFVAFMLHLNHGVTGSWTQTPWQLYAEQYQPGDRPGFGEPVYGTLRAGLPQQKYDLYEQYTRQTVERHSLSHAIGTWLVFGGRPETLLGVVAGPLPLAVAILALALFGITRGGPPMWAMGASILLLLALYTSYPWHGDNYYVPLAPLFWVAAAAGLARLLRPAQWGDRRRIARAAVAVALLAALSVTQLPIAANAVARSTEMPFEETRYLARELDPKLQSPAVVFYRYGPEISYHEEPVYNLDTADPTAGPIVRAHWLGARNRELLEALRERRRDSQVYVYDRRTGRLVNFGPIEQSLRVPTPTTAPSTTRPAM